MARVNPTRQDTFQINLTLNGQGMGIWDKKTGGELDSNELTYMPGGMAPRLSLGGQKLPGNLTLQRAYDRIMDHDKINTFLNAVGKGTVKVTQRPLDFDGHPYGKSVIWHGILKRVNVPDVDSEGNAVAMMEIEITVGNNPAAA
jgi:hypothetical protein